MSSSMRASRAAPTTSVTLPRAAATAGWRSEGAENGVEVVAAAVEGSLGGG